MEEVLRDYEKLLNAGNKAQLEKLKMNEHKDGFDNIDIDDAFEKIGCEYKELAFEFVKKITDKEEYDKIRHEAADIANFAHMIILACDKKLQEKTNASN